MRLRFLTVLRDAVLALSGAAVLAVGAAQAQDSAGRSSPVAVEMFLSQSCKCCPEAADYLTELAVRSDLVVLAFHVDYWDLLSNREHGRWSDPLADAAFSERQRVYNKKLRRRSTVFTPQAIVAGGESAVGSKREKVEAAITRARAAPSGAAIDIVRAGRELSIAVSMDEGEGEALLARFLRRVETAVEGGDNAGRVFAEANVVTEMTSLGAVAPRGARHRVAAPDEGSGCAVLVQAPDTGAILAARYCP